MFTSPCLVHVSGSSVCVDVCVLSSARLCCVSDRAVLMMTGRPPYRNQSGRLGY